jgi:epoxyqueuosine reductase
MNVKEITKELYLRLEKHGYRGKIVSVEHLPELQDEIEGRSRNGELDKEISQRYLKGFNFKVPDSLPQTKSVIIVAAPQPQVQVSFNANGKTLPVLIPSTYFLYTDTDIKNLLTSLLEPNGYHLVKAVLPQKLLAVRSGLAQYGKNNITYVSGMGSFHRPVAFYTDFPCIEDNWGASQSMEQCQACSACCKACPVEAIVPDRFLIHAERCITFFNEKEEDFPEWIDPSWHNCLIGCLLCQRSCPVNKDFLGWIEKREEFSSEETALLLQGVSEKKLPVETVKKLKELDIIEFEYL